jgi:glutamine amidotransferase
MSVDRNVRPGRNTFPDGAILPGVGAFGSAMSEMERKGLVETVRAAAISGRPFVGICAGMQLLFEESEESPGVPAWGSLGGKSFASLRRKG